jgi:hypothetical protein
MGRKATGGSAVYERVERRAQMVLDHRSKAKAEFLGGFETTEREIQPSER